MAGEEPRSTRHSFSTWCTRCTRPPLRAPRALAAARPPCPVPISISVRSLCAARPSNVCRAWRHAVRVQSERRRQGASRSAPCQARGHAARAGRGPEGRRARGPRACKRPPGRSAPRQAPGMTRGRLMRPHVLTLTLRMSPRLGLAWRRARRPRSAAACAACRRRASPRCRRRARAPAWWPPPRSRRVSGSPACPSRTTPPAAAARPASARTHCVSALEWLRNRTARSSSGRPNPGSFQEEANCALKGKHARGSSWRTTLGCIDASGHLARNGLTDINNSAGDQAGQVTCRHGFRSVTRFGAQLKQPEGPRAAKPRARLREQTGQVQDGAIAAQRHAEVHICGAQWKCAARHSVADCTQGADSCRQPAPSCQNSE